MFPCTSFSRASSLSGFSQVRVPSLANWWSQKPAWTNGHLQEDEFKHSQKLLNNAMADAMAEALAMATAMAVACGKLCYTAWADVIVRQCDTVRPCDHVTNGGRH